MQRFVYAVISAIVLVVACVPATEKTPEKRENKKSPVIVVGIVIDQMRFDYIKRYWSDFSEGGFKRLVNEGFSCENHHYSYAPTYTGPGHASIYTGTTPTNHGIISNDWYDRKSKSEVYCAKDTNYQTVGSVAGDGQMSPHRMISSTITDELRLFSNFRSKVFGISIKDRGAVLPAGHLGNGAFWFEGDSTGLWISSNRYMDELPGWLKEYNLGREVDSLMNKNWELLLDSTAYDESGKDHVPYETPFRGKLQTTMPYNISELAAENGNYSILKNVPWGNTMTTDIALSCLKGESLGEDEFTDFLAVSYSTPDYAGHRFGPQSLEIQDIYLRLDLELERLLNELDDSYGSGNYTVFLTADHGVVEIPALSSDLGMPTGKIRPSDIEDVARADLRKELGYDPVEKFINGQFYLDYSMIDSKKGDREEIEEIIVASAMKHEGMLMAFPSEYMLETNFTEGVMSAIQKGYSQSRSGDVLIVPKPGWLMTSYPQGTSHGSVFAYDTHVPCIFFGNGVASGKTYERTHIEDIAPTLAGLLGIQMPSACTGDPITDILD